MPTLSSSRIMYLIMAVVKGTVVQHLRKRIGFACGVDIQNLAALLITDNTAIVALVTDGSPQVGGDIGAE